jgi:hypothetical protein
MDLEREIPPEEPKNETPEERDSGSQDIYSAEESLNASADETHVADPENNGGAAEQDVAASEPTPPADIAERRAASRARNEKLIRRIRWIAAAGFAAFFVMVWLLLRAVGPTMMAGRDPLQVVRAEIGALGRGDLNTAYSQLSRRYRDEVPFNTYHMLVVSHRRVFLTRKYTVSQEEKRGSQIFVVAELESENGTRYTAQFTLVRDLGRWWIDDLHWHAANKNSVQT